MQRNYQLLILSFFLLNIFGWITYAESKYAIPSVVKYILSVSVLGTLIYYRLKNPSKPVPGGLFNAVIIIFVLWSLLLITFSILGFDSLFYIQRVLGQRYFFIPYILPLIILYSKFDLEFYGWFFRYSFLLIVPSLILQIYVILFTISLTNWQEQIALINMFNIGSGFLLLTSHISKKKYIFFIILCYFILWIYMWSFYGRRGVLLEYMIFLLIMIIFRLKSSFLRINDRFKIYYAALLLVVFGLIFGYSLMTSSYALQRGFSKNALDESRGKVFEDFFLDFNSSSDLVFGRGLDGTVLRSINLETGISETIENGFLHLLLKGGMLYLVPFLLILLRACYLGFLRSNNDLVKALASLILIYFIMMSYFSLPDYSTHYIFIWISVSACFTPRLRNYSNAEVYQVINSRFK